MIGFADAVWSFLASGLIHGTVLAAITALVVVTVLRRARPALLAALWTVVLIKFVVPVGPASPVSLNAAIGGLGSGASESETVIVTAPTGAVAPEPGGDELGATGIAKIALSVMWAGGVALLFAVRIRRHRATRRRAEALPEAPEGARVAVARAAAEVRLRRPPRVAVDPDAASPYVLGPRRPLLVVPQWMLGAGDALHAAILHELAHLRRRDAWARGAQVFVATLFFFWPVVGWVGRRLDAAREIACDQWAIDRGPLGRRDYARLLVDLARRARLAGSAPRVSAMALLARPRQLERRVDALLSGSIRPRVGLAGAAVLAVWAVLGLSGAQATDETARAEDDCVYEPRIADTFLAAYPEADADGDGELTRDEACDHQRRLRREAVDGALASVGDPLLYMLDGDLDGNGLISADELHHVKNRLAVSLPRDAFPWEPGMVMCSDEPHAPESHRVCEKETEP